MYEAFRAKQYLFCYFYYNLSIYEYFIIILISFLPSISFSSNAQNASHGLSEFTAQFEHALIEIVSSV